MPQRRRFAAVALLLVASSIAFAQCNQHISFAVTLSPSVVSTPQSGRLLVYMTAGSRPVSHIEPGFGAETRSVWIAGREVHDLKPGATASVEGDEVAFPEAFSKAKPGDYQFEAVLDTTHHLAYSMGEAGAGDISSVVVRAPIKRCSAQRISLTLTQDTPGKRLTPPANSELLDFESPLLSRYYGRPVHIRGIVVLPTEYANSTERFPVVYMTHGFTATLPALVNGVAPRLRAGMDEHRFPPMIWVVLEQAIATGTHEFADSVNNGPYGDALVNELIPWLESKYRMDATPTGRLLTGHSSGGWASLWLQVTYPDTFGGSWPTAPDPPDFRSFTGPDIYAPHGNLYVKPDGSPWMFVRMHGKDVESIKDFAQQEAVLGDYGGQMSSFEAVFSPRGGDGRPLRLFDRETGAIDPTVAHAWQRYDVSRVLRANWARLGPKLDGKIHLIVGDQDTFHLEVPAHLLEQTIRDLGGKPDFRYLPGKDHFNLYQGGLAEQIAKEMYAVARPAKAHVAAAQ